MIHLLCLLMLQFSNHYLTYKVVQLNSMWAFELICVSIFMLILCLVSGHKLSRLYLSWTCTYKSIVINLTLIDGTACQLYNLMNRLQGHNASRYDGCIQSSCKITSLLINSQYTSHNLLVRLSNGFVLYEWKKSILMPVLFLQPQSLVMNWTLIDGVDLEPQVQ